MLSPLRIPWIHWGWTPAVCHSFHCFPIYFPWRDGTRCHDLTFLNVDLLVWLGLVYLFFLLLPLPLRQKKIWQREMSLSILPVFSFSSFKSFRFTFRSLIHFALIFVYVVRKCSSFSLFLLGVQYDQHHLLKKLSFPHFNKLYKIIQSNISAWSQRATLLQRQLMFVPHTQIL